MADDFELIDAWANGDNNAAREILRRHTAPLYRFFEHKIDGPIEDMVQDTLLACIEGRDRFRRETGFRAYVFGIARHVLFAQLRKKHRNGGAIDLESSSLQDPAKWSAARRNSRSSSRLCDTSRSRLRCSSSCITGRT